MTSAAVPNQRPWPSCPAWCVVRHGVLAGEEDWVHISAPASLDVRVLARLCATVDPRSGEMDGPYLLLGEAEYTLAEGLTLGGPAAAYLRRTLGHLHPST